MPAVSRAMSAHIEFLYWNECPSHERALVLLQEAMARHRLSPDQLEVRQIVDEPQAQRERFVGSPTIRIDGDDITPPPEDQPYALSCRLYRHRNGRPSPLPDFQDLDDALAAAGTLGSSKGDHQ